MRHLFCGILFAGFGLACAAADDLAAFVDVFTGTGGTGHAHPGASYPFGMIQAGPDTGTGDWKYCSGYQYADRQVIGYSQNRLSGTGCTDLGDVQVLPFTGARRPLPMASAIDKSSERGEPGFYSVVQEQDGVLVEIAAAKRAAIYRFTWRRPGARRMLVNLPFGEADQAGNTGNKTVDAEVRAVGSAGLEGRFRRTRTWVEGRVVAFALSFDRPWRELEELERPGATAAPRYCATFDLKDGEPLLMKVSVCATDADGARNNLADAIPDWDFERVRSSARTAWNDLFARTACEGSRLQKTNWYTSLYHLYLQPNDWADADGRTRGADGAVRAGAAGSAYTTLSLWDTFRAAQPWYTLATPDVAAGVVRSLLAQGREIGRIPVMSHGGRNVDCMIGNHGVSVIVDAFLKSRAGELGGLDDIDWEAAYRLVKETLTQEHAGKIKEDWPVYDRHGYYPFDLIRAESVSRTLECGFDDWCAAQMAERLGHGTDAAFFARRAAGWRKVFDPSLGLVRGRDAKGGWRTPFNPYALGGGDERANDFTEGNAFQYTWHVLQDPEGLVAAMGGREAFAARLDALFALPESAEGMGTREDVTGLIGQYAHGNEPSHHVAYLYPYAGRPDRTAEVVREIVDRFYRPGPEGLCGNDDCGQMSAWYLFAAAGFYPVTPCGGDYVLGAPQVPKVTFRLPNGRTFTVEARNLSSANKHVQAIRLDGRPFDGLALRQSDILKGGSLVFEMTDDVRSPTRRLSLDGAWELRYFRQPESAPVRTVPLPEGLPVETVDARVPGNCELDLVRAGRAPDPEIGTNAYAFRKWEGHEWLYAKTFTGPAAGPEERLELVLDGVDTLADVFLNGEKVGSCDNMLIPWRFDVTDRVRAQGTNRVEVLIRSAFMETRDKSLGQLGRTMTPGPEGELLRKAAHMGGWDIFPRLFVSGLWRGVRIETVSTRQIDETYHWVYDLDVTNRTARLSSRFRVKAPFDWIDRAQVRATLTRANRVVASKAVPFRHYHGELRFALEDVDFWWPRGMGEAALYDMTLELVAPDGHVASVRRDRIGLRTVTLERADRVAGKTDGEFLFRVNGERCFIRGTNWVPLDAFHGRDGDRLDETALMLADLNCNMVRLWGGGVYEPDAFYDFCDREGILVWQDFMTASGIGPQDDDMARRMAEEARSVVLRLRNHPSLALWCGNNENDAAPAWTYGERRIDPNRDRTSRRTIPDVLYEHDFARAYLPSSPYVSPTSFAGLTRPSEDHLWSRTCYKGPGYLDNPARFVSEMGYHGCPNRASLERMMPKDSVYPWLDGSWRWNAAWQAKAVNPFDDPTSELARTRNNYLLDKIRLALGEVPRDLDGFISASQFVQAEALKTWIERYRMEKFTKKTGLLWWNLRDGWPIISDAIVDYYGGRKRAYEAVKTAQATQLVALKPDGTAWAVNAARHPVAGRAVFSERATGRAIAAFDYRCPANASAQIGVVALPSRGFVDIAYTAGAFVGANHHFVGP